MKLKIPFNVVGYIDRRGPRELEAARALEQARADKAIEDLWRERVRENEERRLLSLSMGGRGMGTLTGELTPSTRCPLRQPAALQHALTRDLPVAMPFLPDVRGLMRRQDNFDHR